MTTLQGAELGFIQQALITGQVSNALTGEAILLYSLHIEMRLPTADDFMSLPFQMRQRGAGYFAVPGDPLRVPQDIANDQNLTLRFSAAAEGFQDLVQEVAISGADLVPTAVQETLAGHAVEYTRLDSPLLHQALALQPEAVGLRGTLISDNDPDAPQANASIQVVAPVSLPAVTSDARGRFSIDALPIVQTVTINAELDGESTSVNHVIDYTTPLNTRIISLNG